MGHRVTASMLGCALVSLAGCSLIYNPANLPDPRTDGDLPPDVMPDSEDKLDANSALLSIDEVFPVEIFEGTGTGGSRQGILTVHGMNIVAGAKISVASHAGSLGDPKITIDDANTDVAANGNIVAAPFTLDINDQLADGARIRLDVTVTQPNGASTVSATLQETERGTAALEVVGLDELTGPAVVTGSKEYSEVNADSITATPAVAMPVIIHARGRINVTGAVTANANGIDGGAGGNKGGAGGPILNPGQPGDGPGGAGTGGQPGTNGGGGGFFAVGGGAGGPASGQPELLTLDVPNRSSGGGGGNGRAVLNGGAGGFGGGGGGSIALTAGGTISLTTIEAKGANGENVDNSNGDGGGGSGGVVLLRGAEVTATINVDGGGGGSTGSIGRSRVDAGTKAAATAAYRGIMLDKATPIITKDPTPEITVYGADNVSFKYRIKSLTSSQVSNNLDGSIGPDGENTFDLGAELFRGLNEVCVFVPGADLVNQRDEARNCVQIVYLFTP
jgi:hypothetical protein